MRKGRNACRYFSNSPSSAAVQAVSSVTASIASIRHELVIMAPTQRKASSRIVEDLPALWIRCRSRVMIRSAIGLISEPSLRMTA